MALTPFQDNEQVSRDVDVLVQDLEKLRSAYEMYFLGLDRKEPQKLRASVSNLIKKYSGAAVQNARIKFRIQQTVARYNTYTLYWDRVLREIEEGTYQRDVFKAKIHEKERGIEEAPSPKPKASSAPQAKGDPVQQLFDQYVATRKKCNEAVQGLTLEAFRKTLSTQIDTIKKKTGATSVRFQIAVDGGKTKLKAIPQTAKKPS